MRYIDGQGNVNLAQITRHIRQVAKSVDDTLYHCFDDIKPENRFKVLEAIKILKNMAAEIEAEEDDLFKI
jgi:cell division protein ZapA (FtsZ GTPase activity inhibitor)